MQKVDNIAALGINGVRADKPSTPRTGIYTLCGQKLSAAQKLPSGIYIVNGKKRVVTK